MRGIVPPTPDRRRLAENRANAGPGAVSGRSAGRSGFSPAKGWVRLADRPFPAFRIDRGDPAAANQTSCKTPTIPARSKPPRRNSGTNRARSTSTSKSPKPKFYCLSMLPYPSGALHMGHVRNYTIGDVISRYQRMQRQERAAADGVGRVRPAGRERGDQEQHRAGEVDLREHRAHARAARRRSGYAIDWSREFATCKPEYYVHEQRMFMRLLKKGLAYRKKSVVNWDPVDQTVLANEQVDRRPRLAHRRAGREARDPAVVPQDHRLRRGTAGRASTHCRAGRTRSRPCSATGSGAREGARDPVRRGRRQAIRMTVFTTRPDTLMGATFCRSRPSIRWR